LAKRVLAIKKVIETKIIFDSLRTRKNGTPRLPEKLAEIAFQHKVRQFSWGKEIAYKGIGFITLNHFSIKRNLIL